MTDWREQAACRGVDLSVFFPEGMRNTTAPAIAAAKQICERCPVRAVCLADHLNETHGVWGGTSAREREALRRKQRWAERERLNARLEETS